MSATEASTLDFDAGVAKHYNQACDEIATYGYHGFNLSPAKYSQRSYQPA